jgi:hypothetical protein
MKVIRGDRRQMVSKCQGIYTDLELSRATGHHISSHCASRSFSDISDKSGCVPGPTWSGGMWSAKFGVGAVSRLRVEAGLATESEDPLLFVKVWLR